MGRWSPAGRHAIYTSQHVSLAMLEVLVHAPNPLQRKIPRVLFRLDVEEQFVSERSIRAVPKPFPPSTAAEETQPLGDAWITSGTSVGLLVPSAIVNFEFNAVGGQVRRPDRPGSPRHFSGEG